MSYELDKNFTNSGKPGIVLLDLSGGPGTSDDVANSVYLDSGDNIIVAGYTYANGTKDFAIVKLDQSGNYVKSFYNEESDISGVVILDLSVSSVDEASSVSVDSEDNIIVAGTTYTNGGSSDFAIVKLDQSGNYVKSFYNEESDISGVVILDLSGSGISFDKVYSVYVDRQDNIIVAGVSEANDNRDFAIVKLDQNGNYVSDFKNNDSDISGLVILDLSGSSVDEAYSVYVDTEDNIIVTGYTYTGANFHTDFAIVKLDQSGNYVSDFKNNDSDISGLVILDLSGGSNDTARSVYVDRQDNIIVAGYMNANNNRDFAIVKLDKNGNYVQNFTNTEKHGLVILDLSGSSTDEAFSVSVDRQDNIIVAGYTNANKDFAIVKLDKNGNYVENFKNNNSYISGLFILDISGGNDEARSVYVDSEDNIIVAGYTNVNESNYFAIVKLKYIKGTIKTIHSRGFNIYRRRRISPYDEWLKKRNKKINQ